MDKSRSHVPAPGARDPNDEKAMVNSTANSADKGRTVEASNTTLNEYKSSPIEAYYEFPSSDNQVIDPFTPRMPALVDALGNKDSVKG